MTVWRDFKHMQFTEGIWDAYLQHVMLEHFLRWSKSGLENRTKEIHGSITTHTGRSILFISHVRKANDKIMFYMIFFKIFVLYENV